MVPTNDMALFEDTWISSKDYTDPTTPKSHFVVIQLTININNWHQKQGQLWTMLNTFLNFRTCLWFHNALMVGNDYKSHWVEIKFFEILKRALRNISKPTEDAKNIWLFYFTFCRIFQNVVALHWFESS